MQPSWRAIAGLIMLMPLASTVSAQNSSVQQAFNTPVTVERSAPVTSVPLNARGGKLYLRASVQGNDREFIFDTGSPTILSKTFADQLDLEIIGQNTGVDANGTNVTMDVAVVDEITLGDVTFRDVPVLIFDYAQIPLGTCFFDGGVIGSELLPGSAWRIDLERKQLDIGSSAQALGVSSEASQTRLHDFGYPHMPVVDYSINGFSDKALFDTGNSGVIALFENIADDRNVRRAMERGSKRQGEGTEGVSAGGMGALVDLQRFVLKDLHIGEHTLEQADTVTRQTPPTLIGTGILDNYKVTLDYPASMMRWEPRMSPSPKIPDQGFSVMFVENVATVVQLFNDSPADRIGLQLGDQVTELSGRSLTATDENERCEHSRWLSEAYSRTPANTITILRDSEMIQLELN